MLGGVRRSQNGLLDLAELRGHGELSAVASAGV